MSARNRSPLGFGIILSFHLCVLATGVLLQNAHAGWGMAGFAVLLGVVIGGAVVFVAMNRRFLWDLFRNFKSAAVLLSLLVFSCILGTLIIQDLDLRRAGVFDPGIAPQGAEVPPFDRTKKSTRYAVAESHALLWIWPSEERRRLTEEKVRLSRFEEQRAELREKVFGEDSADAFREAVKKSKKRQVDDLTTSHFAREHFTGLYRSWLLVRRLHLFDIFEAWWFYMLLGLIGVNVIVGTIARAPWNVRDLGVAITHAGIITILTGAFLDVLVAEEGYIEFTYGRPELQSADRIFDEKNNVHYRLPFTVRLDRFATEHYHELLVERIRLDDAVTTESPGSGTNGTGTRRAARPSACRARRSRSGPAFERLYEDRARSA